MNISARGLLIRRCHMEIRSRIGHTIIGSCILAQFSSWKNVRVKKDTACCIEGYPRCANTFAVVAFASAQPSTVTLAHHSHLAGQVLLADRRKLPILLLVRPPQDAVASLMVRDPHITPMMMLKDYERFYRALIPIIDNLLVADFDQVIGDFGLVIQRLNQKFNTSFVAFEHTPANVGKCVKQIEEIDRKCGGRKRVAESQVSRPSADRKLMLNKCKIAISHKNNQTILSKCEALYKFFVETSSKANFCKHSKSE